MTTVDAGLCEHCRHQRVVRTTRGSRFSLCGRHTTDPGFPKYPRVPVLECRGYERLPDAGQAEHEVGRGD